MMRSHGHRLKAVPSLLCEDSRMSNPYYGLSGGERS